MIVVALLVALFAGAPDRQAIGVWHGWGAFRESSPARCFALATPVRRGTGAFASVATRPDRGIRNQVALHLSRPVRDGLAPTLSIDERRFTLTAQGDNAWAPDARTDAAIVAAMRSARSMSVSGVSTTGRPFADTYALPGAASAIDAAALACLPR
ncbi:invasion associated locus B family protein [Hephaestia mangrovi]|uniref:invasion associated locus B family protein n=1 Tax=Hephaestia mangrovi TaxID=2873268 RepID=UPI001CA6D552|nr:invasion associated locus B family protein [Hephaestia mangrovi]MBY8829074.1 hypothetical protein [Hephaestia mangrovi]